MSHARPTAQPRKVLVTGATGFVGRALVEELVLRGHDVTALSRRTLPQQQIFARRSVSVDLGVEELPEDVLLGTDVIIHLAARAHDRRASREDFETNTVNVARNVARPAAHARVPKTILMSSIGARLAETREAVREYGLAKLRAEAEFRDQYDSTPCRLIILRPPVIYSACAPGSFGTLVRWIRRRRLLPFALARAQRSYLALDNLVELICQLAAASDDQWNNADGLEFEPSDLRPISTRELAISLGRELDRPARLAPLPRWLMMLAGRVLGKQDLVSGAFDALTTRTMPSLEVCFGWRARTQIGETPVFKASPTQY